MRHVAKSRIFMFRRAGVYVCVDCAGVHGIPGSSYPERERFRAERKDSASLSWVLLPTSPKRTPLGEGLRAGPL